MELTAATIAADTGGRLVGAPDVQATGFGIDTRRLGPGACFVALVAARDGHDYLADAWQRGATVAVVSRPVPAPPAGAAVVEVTDGMDALTDLGRAARARLADARVVGITGSAGKTGTKDLTAAAVAPCRRVHASPESYNNEAGVPLTLLGAEPGTDVVVTEMGARFAGNIRHLADIARPDVGVITNIGLAHAGHLGGPEGVAAVKGELVEALPSDGLAVLNADCPFVEQLTDRSAARVLTAGHTRAADVRIEALAVGPDLRLRFRLVTPWGSATVELPLRGEHHATNAAMAVAVAVEVGVPLDAAVTGLAAVRPSPLRMALTTTPAGVTVLNDAYNSSPTSAAAALHALARLDVSGRRVAVLGEMLELGEYAAAAHADLGTLAADLGIDVVVAVGEGTGTLAQSARAAGVTVLDPPDPTSAAALVLATVASGDGVLVKASRAVGIERVAAVLLDAEEPAP